MSPSHLFVGHTRLVPVHTHTKSGIQIEEGAVEGAGARERTGQCLDEEDHAWDEAEIYLMGLVG